MQFFRLMAIGVVLLVLAGASLGTACAGAKGEQGPEGADGVGIENIVNNGDGTVTVNLTNGKTYTTDNLTNGKTYTTDNLTGPQGSQGIQGVKGDTGAQGPQGIAGPNMIVAMGCIDGSGFIIRGYNITSCIWNDAYQRYDITLTGIYYLFGNYVTLVTPSYLVGHSAGYGDHEGKLMVEIQNSAGDPIQGTFSFMVLAIS